MYARYSSTYLLAPLYIHQFIHLLVSGFFYLITHAFITWGNCDNGFSFFSEIPENAHRTGFKLMGLFLGHLCAKNPVE